MFTDVSEALASSVIKELIVLTMEGASTSETSVNFQQISAKPVY
jgi:hypothetical protein